MLIEAAVRCLARDGIQGFTIERICAEAGVSRGLINHYFDGKDGLLIEVYRGSLYETVSTRMAKVADSTEEDDDSSASRIAAIIDATFDPEVFNRDMLRVWLALWGEIASNRALREVHRALYRSYRTSIAHQIGRTAAARGIDVDSERLAIGFLSLVDGLWLEWCLDESVVDLPGARAIARAMLEAELGPIIDT